jgi:hypothetical protein
MYDEKLNWNKSSTWASNILELRFFYVLNSRLRWFMTQKFQTNTKAWNNLISNLESKAKVITCGKIWYGGLILAVGNKNSHSNTRVPKISQISPTTQWHSYAHFWYSKVDLDWVGIDSKNCIFRGNTALKTAEQRLTKLSITLCQIPYRVGYKNWEMTQTESVRIFFSKLKREENLI